LALLRAFALGSLLYAAGVSAQITGTVTVVSDYRFRGVSLSQQKPAAQVTIGYDDPSGWYGGAFGSTVQLAGESATAGQAVVFLGVVTPVGGGFHWDVGANYSVFSDSRDYDYGEVYTGVTSQNFSARVHYSPDYFGFARGSFYGEVNGTRPLGDGFVLLGHIGVLVPVGHGDDPDTTTVRNPVDARAGLGLEIAGFNVQVAWVGTNGTGSLYPVYGAQRRNTVVMSVSRSF
jgi:uncharacterized protein (TIGR02001 family)